MIDKTKTAGLQLAVWHPDKRMADFFLNRGIVLPAQLIPDGKYRSFHCAGLTLQYVATTDSGGSHVSVYIRYQADGYDLRCAECQRRDNDEYI